jgi:VanZ family protein
MGLIFVGSTDLLSNHQTSRFIGPVVRWFYPEASAHTIRTVQMVVRKTGHLTEYAILAAVLWRALALSLMRSTWSWRRAGLCFAVSVGYAVTDELHQVLVTTRQGAVADVFIDAVGAALGLFVVWWLIRRQPGSKTP